MLNSVTKLLLTLHGQNLFFWFAEVGLIMESIPAIEPTGDGHQFVFYGDCCSGVPGMPWERNFARINGVLQRLEPRPEFIIFLGDHIMGRYSKDSTLEAQWRYWLDCEMDWLDTKQTPMYHTTSNHNTYDSTSERIFRETFPGIPTNGPADQKGLSYWVRRGDALFVFVNTHFSLLGGKGHVEISWLDETLRTNADARYKIVAGHQPIFPVNGYDERPLWCVVEDEAEAFWSVLVRRKVVAYLCSHVIAFDQQQHDGVYQICSGGAGTEYGPGGVMGDGEYRHLVQAALDVNGLRLQTVDETGKVRESLSAALPER